MRGERVQKSVKTFDHPEAGGKTAQKGDVEYCLSFTLEDDSVLTVRMGQKGFDTSTQIMLDMLSGHPPYDDGSLK